jgi:hypothetical protein
MGPRAGSPLASSRTGGPKTSKRVRHVETPEKTSAWAIQIWDAGFKRWWTAATFASSSDLIKCAPRVLGGRSRCYRIVHVLTDVQTTGTRLGEGMTMRKAVRA